MKKIITDSAVEEFENYLRFEEKSENTIQKYIRDVRFLREFASVREISKTLAIEFKAYLAEKYELSSSNSMIAAVNAFFRFLGWGELCIKQFKIQRTAIYHGRSRAQGRDGGYLQKQDPNDLYRSGIAEKAIELCQKKQNCDGRLFITKAGKPMERCSIWREMKRLCKDAHVSPAKVFPHNLRHLFARMFYGIEKDIAKLADILGHSNINTTRIYIIAIGEEHKRKMENMHLII